MIKLLLATPLCGLLFFSTLVAQTDNKKSNDGSVCSQDSKLRNELIDEATRTEFNTRHVEIVGNTYTGAREFFKRMVEGMNEGDIFTRAALEKSVRRISGMRAIYSITMDNVKIRLDRPKRYVDVSICVRQKPK